MTHAKVKNIFVHWYLGTLGGSQRLQVHKIYGLVQDNSISSALAVEILYSYNKPSKWPISVPSFVREHHLWVIM